MIELMYLKNGDISIYISGKESDTFYQGILNPDKVLYQMDETIIAVEEGFTIYSFILMLEKYPLYMHFHPNIKDIVSELHEVYKDDNGNSKYTLYMVKAYGEWKSLGKYNSWIFLDPRNIDNDTYLKDITYIDKFEDFIYAPIKVVNDIIYTVDSETGELQKYNSITDLEFVITLIKRIEIWYRLKYKPKDNVSKETTPLRLVK